MYKYFQEDKKKGGLINEMRSKTWNFLKKNEASTNN
jgi:hypothetical protein